MQTVALFGVLGAWLLWLGLRVRSIEIRGLWAIVGLLPLHAVADATANYFEGGLVDPSSFRTAVALILLALVAHRARVKGLGILTLVMLGYFLLRSAASSDPVYSIMSWLKFAVPTVMLLYGLGMTGDRREAGAIVWSVVVAAIIIQVQIAFAQLFQSGESLYIEDSLYLGGGSVQTAYTLVIGVLCAPLFGVTLPSGWKKGAGYLLGLIAVVTVLVMLRRGAILGLAGGLVAFLFIYRKRVQALAVSLVVVLMLMASFPLYESLLHERLEGREIMERRIQDEMRYVETFYVIDDIERGGWVRAMFGVEMLNSGFYFYRYMNGRILHIDYNLILHGSGLVGLFLFLGLHAALGFALVSWRPLRRDDQAWRACGLAVLVATLLFGLSGPLLVQTSRAAAMLVIGYALARKRRERREHRRANFPSRFQLAR